MKCGRVNGVHSSARIFFSVHKDPIMTRTLVIGYGNIYRADDGVAYHVINALRRRLGHQTLPEGDSGMEELGGEVDSLFLSQLVPELLDLLSGYDRVIFVDAHVDESIDDLHCMQVVPEFTPSMLTHHMTPATLLALLKTLYHRELTGHIVSIRGYDFNFHRNLSSDTMSLIEPAVERILPLFLRNSPV